MPLEPKYLKEDTLVVQLLGQIPFQNKVTLDRLILSSLNYA